jgi:hypothetical protein
LEIVFKFKPIANRTYLLALSKLPLSFCKLASKAVLSFVEIAVFAASILASIALCSAGFLDFTLPSIALQASSNLENSGVTTSKLAASPAVLVAPIIAFKAGKPDPVAVEVAGAVAIAGGFATGGFSTGGLELVGADPVVAGADPVVAGADPVVAGAGSVVAGAGSVVVGAAPVVADSPGGVVAGLLPQLVILRTNTLPHTNCQIFIIARK